MPLFVDLVFWGLSSVAIGAALGVVLVRDLFRAALLLVAHLATVLKHAYARRNGRAADASPVERPASL